MADLPPALVRLLAQMSAAVAEATGVLVTTQQPVEQWQRELEQLLARYHAAAYMAGQGSPTLDAAGSAAVTRAVEAQLAFLDNFAVEIQSAQAFKPGWQARADMYAQSVKGSYWRGATKVLPLPAMPTEGTQCLTRCGCSWEIDEIDGEAGDWDAYWRLGKSDNCTTCLERSQQWAPIRIRGGEVL